MDILKSGVKTQFFLLFKFKIMSLSYFAKKDVGFNAKNSPVVSTLRQDRKVGYVLGSARKSEAFHSALKKNMVGHGSVTREIMEKTISTLRDSNRFSKTDEKMVKHLLEGRVLDKLVHGSKKVETRTEHNFQVGLSKSRYDEIMGKPRNVIQDSAPGNIFIPNIIKNNNKLRNASGFAKVVDVEVAEHGSIAEENNSNIRERLDAIKS